MQTSWLKSVWICGDQLDNHYFTKDAVSLNLENCFFKKGFLFYQIIFKRYLTLWIVPRMPKLFCLLQNILDSYSIHEHWVLSLFLKSPDQCNPLVLSLRLENKYLLNIKLWTQYCISILWQKEVSLTECAKLRASRAFVPLFLTCLPYFTCLTRLHFFCVPYVPSFFYLPYVSSFCTCLTCLQFFPCLTCLPFFTCLTCPHFFTCLMCLHFFNVPYVTSFFDVSYVPYVLSSFYVPYASSLFYIKCGATHNQSQQAGKPKIE